MINTGCELTIYTSWGAKAKLTNDAEELVIHQDKKLSDRSNILIAAQSFLFGGIATLLSDFNLESWHAIIPVVICLTGVSINIVWWLSNANQIRKTRQALISLTQKKRTSPLLSSLLDTRNENNPKLSDVVSEWMPFVLSMGWLLTLTFYILYFFVPL